MGDCIFCKIVNKEIPNYIVYEDKTCLAFLDVHPHAQGHTVVIPKVHAKSYFDLPTEEILPLFLAIKETMTILKDKLGCAGFNVGWNDGEVAGQVVPHLHIHILPRYDGDGGGSMHSIIKNPGDVDVKKVAELFKSINGGD